MARDSLSILVGKKEEIRKGDEGARITSSQAPLAGMESCGTVSCKTGWGLESLFWGIIRPIRILLKGKEGQWLLRGLCPARGDGPFSPSTPSPSPPETGGPFTASVVPFPERRIMESHGRHCSQTGFFHFAICMPPWLFMT